MAVVGNSSSGPADFLECNISFCTTCVCTGRSASVRMWYIAFHICASFVCQRLLWQVEKGWEGGIAQYSVQHTATFWPMCLLQAVEQGTHIADNM